MRRLYRAKRFGSLLSRRARGICISSSAICTETEPLGRPVLIFPTADAISTIKPGTPIDSPVLTTKPARPNQRGIVETVIIAPEPIPGVNAAPQKLAYRQLADWEQRWGSHTSRVIPVDAASGSTGPLPGAIFRSAAKPSDPMLVNVEVKLLRGVGIR